ncbi:MAG TPA: hypothetical protein VMA30_09940 [Xanthobacteraceae bacterium]|nr:hypothetical protein [Xanthobacteraceae bacterium]
MSVATMYCLVQFAKSVRSRLWQRFHTRQRKGTASRRGGTPALPLYFAGWLDFELMLFKTASCAGGLSYAAAWQV